MEKFIFTDDIYLGCFRLLQLLLALIYSNTFDASRRYPFCIADANYADNDIFQHNNSLVLLDREV